MYVLGEVGFILLKGIGAPHATTVFEELIVFGAEEFIVIGTAGGLQKKVCFYATEQSGMREPVIIISVQVDIVILILGLLYILKFN